ncbi:MAG TPA: AI-2E family transporter [Gemmatimonadales bacterium]|nr:AI-2E family transporter [Gemmatimonadales bacterium]
MPVLLANRQRAALLILVLGLALVYTLMPYASGLIGGLVLVVIFAPVHARLARRLPPRLSAALMVLLALLILIVPSLSLAGVLVEQAQGIAAGIVSAPLLERISAFEIGGVPIGPRLAGMGEQVVGWLGSSAIGLLGHATRLGLNLTIALFILYFLLLRPRQTWEAVRPYIPFRPASADRLRDRFRDVTISTLIGTGAIALIQGIFVGAGFLFLGLSNALFWGVVTIVFAILPVVGAGLVWGPGVVSLMLDGRYGAATALALLGLVVVANVDVVIRPAVFRRFAEIHPLVTLIGAIGGISYFGLLGILIGPLAISYFFELIRMYREEYHLAPATASGEVASGSG